MSLLRRGLGRLMGGRARGNFTGGLMRMGMEKAQTAIGGMLKHGKNGTSVDPESSVGAQSKTKYSTGEYYD